MALIDDIEDFLASTGTSPTALGQHALGDRHFVRQLRAGRRVWPETERKVRDFIAERLTNHGASVSSPMTGAPTGQAAEMSGGEAA